MIADYRLVRGICGDIRGRGGGTAVGRASLISDERFMVGWKAKG